MPSNIEPQVHPSEIDLPERGRTMVKKLDTCYGIRKGRGAPVVVHSWTEVVNKVSSSNTGSLILFVGLVYFDFDASL